MKFKLLLIVVFGLFFTKITGQNLSISNGTLKFSSLAIYEQYAENILNQNEIILATQSIKTFANLPTPPAVEDSDDPEPADSLYPEFLRLILNTDKIVTIGNFLVKIDLDNHIGLVIAANAPKAYNTLLLNNTAASGIMVFSDEDDDAIDILEAIEAGTLTVANYKTMLVAQRCKRAKRQKDATFQYWMQFPSSICPGRDYCYKGEDKIVYQKAIFYFSIEAKRKSQKECCFDTRVTRNPKRHFVNLKIEGTVKYRKRCGTEVNTPYNNELFNNHKITWRPYSDSRSLSNLDASVKFYIQEIIDRPPTPPPYIPSKLYRIVDGY
jgi:hypothetical protein